MTQHHPLLTVLGTDKKGIVAQISTLLWKNKINIEEIRQGIIEGNFFMVMSIDITETTRSFPQLQKDLEALGEELGVHISLYNEELFHAMHAI